MEEEDQEWEDMVDIEDINQEIKHKIKNNLFIAKILIYKQEIELQYNYRWIIVFIINLISLFFYFIFLRILLTLFTK